MTVRYKAKKTPRGHWGMVSTKPGTTETASNSKRIGARGRKQEEFNMISCTERLLNGDMGFTGKIQEKQQFVGYNLPKNSLLHFPNVLSSHLRWSRLFGEQSSSKEFWFNKGKDFYLSGMSFHARGAALGI